MRFWHTLAGHLGQPVGRLRRGVTEREFRDWQAILGTEPPVGVKLDWWLAQLLAAALNPHRGEKDLPVKGTDLMPDWWGERAAVENSGGGLAGFVAWLKASAEGD